MNLRLHGPPVLSKGPQVTLTEVHSDSCCRTHPLIVPAWFVDFSRPHDVGRRGAGRRTGISRDDDRSRHRRARRHRAWRDDRGHECRHEREPDDRDERERGVHRHAPSTRDVPHRSGAPGLQDVRTRSHRAPHGRDRHRQHSAPSRRRRGNCDGCGRLDGGRKQSIDARANDGKQTCVGAAAQRPPSLHAAAAHGRHVFHADDVWQHRVLWHARLGHERQHLNPWEPNRQQRIPARRRAEFGHGRLAIRAAGGCHRGVQGTDRERRRVLRPYERRRRQHDAQVRRERVPRLRYIPMPNVTGESFTNANNLAASPNLGLYRYNSYLTRIDHKFSDRHRVFVTSTANWGVEFRNSNGFPVPALRGEWPKHRNHYMDTFDDVFTMSSSTLLNIRASYDRFNDYNPRTYADLNEDLGIQTPFQNIGQYPYITIDSYQDFFPGVFSQTLNNIYSVQASVSKTAGRHFVKLGGELRNYRLDRVSLGDANGRLDFSRGFTPRDPQSGDATSGNAFASFLLGYSLG